MPISISRPSGMRKGQTGIGKAGANQVAFTGSKALAHGVTFTKTPSLQEWQKASSVRLATRADDPLLTRIDALVGSYDATASQFVKLQLKADLFFTLDYWLKTFRTRSEAKNKREPAVYGLYAYTADTLAQMFDCGVNALPELLETHFGRKLGFHGEKLDHANEYATYLSRAQVDKYRITFRKGRAYMFTWPGKGTELNGAETEPPKGTLRLVLANSAAAANPSVFRKDATWGGFAMSMGREIYMARHHCGDGASGPGQKGNFYHSSYLGGDPVLCAGTMVIKDGVITAVCNDSGHYQPDDMGFIGLLQALKMQNVNLHGITVTNYNQTLVADGGTFLTNHGNWASAILKGGKSVFTSQVKIANENARKLWARDRNEVVGYLNKLWNQALKAGIVADTPEGRLFFVQKLFPNYTVPAVVQGRVRDTKPFQAFVATDWLLTALTTVLDLGANHPLPVTPRVAAVAPRHHQPLPRAPGKR